MSSPTRFVPVGGRPAGRPARRRVYIYIMYAKGFGLNSFKQQCCSSALAAGLYLDGHRGGLRYSRRVSEPLSRLLIAIAWRWLVASPSPDAFFGPGGSACLLTQKCIYFPVCGRLRGSGDVFPASFNTQHQTRARA